MTARADELLKLMRAKHPGYHPILSLADLAHDADASIAQRADCHKTILKYVEPELKSVEVKADVSGDFGTLRVVMEAPPEDIPTELPDNLDDVETEDHLVANT